ncbi:unnamed protein product [Arctogadus glacialis]
MHFHHQMFRSDCSVADTHLTTAPLRHRLTDGLPYREASTLEGVKEGSESESSDSVSDEEAESSLEQTEPEQEEQEQPEPEGPEQPLPLMPQPELEGTEQPLPEMPQPEPVGLELPLPEMPQPEPVGLELPQPELPQPEQPQPELAEPELSQTEMCQPEQPHPEPPKQEQPQPGQCHPEQPQPEQPQPPQTEQHQPEQAKLEQPTPWHCHPEQAELEQPQPEPHMPEEPQPEQPQPVTTNAQENIDPLWSESPLSESPTGTPLSSHLPATPSALPEIASLPTSTGIPDLMTPPPDSYPTHDPFGDAVTPSMPYTDPINADIAYAVPEVAASNRHACTERGSVAGDVGAGEDPLHVTIFPPDTATPFPHVTMSTSSPHFHTQQPMPVSCAEAAAGIPICFTIHYPPCKAEAAEAGPLRGDV